MTRLYLAGPMRDYPSYNFPAFDAAAARLRAAGYSVVSPAEMDRDLGFDPDVDEADDAFVDGALRRDVRAIAGCDAVALLDGWQASQGVAVELQVARALGLDLLDEHGRPITEAAPAVDGEVRIVNAETGGAKGSKLARFDLIPAGPLWTLAEHYGRGARKYEDRNWERGYDWSLSFAALMRHAWAWWSGEDIDPETGSPHMAAVAWHAFAALEWAATHPEFDNRPSGPAHVGDDAADDADGVAARAA